jgi:hypothetical protein
MVSIVSSTAVARQSVFLVLLLMCAVPGAQAVSLFSEQTHPHSGHCCALCHGGPLPFLQSEAVCSFVPVLSMVWLETSSGVRSIREILLANRSSRAPPA